MTPLKKKLYIAIGCLFLISLAILPLAVKDRGNRFDFLGNLNTKEKVFAVTGSGTISSPGHPEMVVAVDSVMLKGVTEDEAAAAINAVLPDSDWIKNVTFFESKQKWTSTHPYSDSITVIRDGEDDDQVLIQRTRRFKLLEQPWLAVQHKLQGL
jgi:hypothetical protein